MKQGGNHCGRQGMRGEFWGMNDCEYESGGSDWDGNLYREVQYFTVPMW